MFGCRYFDQVYASFAADYQSELASRILDTQVMHLQDIASIVIRMNEDPRTFDRHLQTVTQVPLVYVAKSTTGKRFVATPIKYYMRSNIRAAMARKESNDFWSWLYIGNR
jgi:hypothetical protein